MLVGRPFSLFCFVLFGNGVNVCNCLCACAVCHVQCWLYILSQYGFFSPFLWLIPFCISNRLVHFIGVDGFGWDSYLFLDFFWGVGFNILHTSELTLTVWRHKSISRCTNNHSWWLNWTISRWHWKLYGSYAEWRQKENENKTYNKLIII